MEESRTSEEWQKLCRVTVLDPDGWNRLNYQFSWHEELIDRDEFEKRMVISTCQFPSNDFRDNKVWKLEK